MPWTSFACSPEEVILKHTGLLPQVTYAMQYLFCELNSMGASLRHLPSVQLKPCPFEKLLAGFPLRPEIFLLRVSQ